MGTPREPEKSLLFVGLLFGSSKELHLAEERLGNEFGNIAQESRIFDWAHSHYYEDELGSPIRRKFILFDKIISPEEIADIKVATNRIEQELSKDRKRTVNIDPGYITAAKIVLASTKNYCHRIYLGKGIYAEVTLYYKDGGFHPTPFTFNDYRQREYIEFFKKAREFLK
ncbi:hypothetical protein BMS3Abin07_01876 [bacterium BMS3Abin07]|nr:hypothetical protein BMS3Abin07_01876 [bacterium BMS3Abin07]GBE32049.1 hypothetical protein BMS3Bbin05_00957 [bacterium BMS3Bbin05]HDO23530.1 DUF4416 family protein [Nitrospirota bacterium]